MDVQLSRDYERQVSPQRGSSRSPNQSENYLRPTASTRIAYLTRSGALQTGDYERSPISGSKMSFAMSSSKKTPSPRKSHNNLTDNGALSSKRQRYSIIDPIEVLRDSREKERSNSPRRYVPFLLSTIVPDLPYDPNSITNTRFSSAPRLPTEPIRTFGKLERMMSSSLQEGMNLSASLNGKEGCFFGGELNLVRIADRGLPSCRTQFDVGNQETYLSDQNTPSSSQNSDNSEWSSSRRHVIHSRNQNGSIRSEVSKRTYLPPAQEAELMESAVSSTALKTSVEDDIYAVSGYPARSAVQRRDHSENAIVEIGTGTGGGGGDGQHGVITDRSTVHKIGSTPGMHWSEENFDSIPMREMPSTYSMENSLLRTDLSHVPAVHREIFTPSPNIPLGILKSAYMRTPPVGPRVVFSDSAVLSGDIIPSYDTGDYSKIRYDMTDDFEESEERSGDENTREYGGNKFEESEYENKNKKDDNSNIHDGNILNSIINNKNSNLEREHTNYDAENSDAYLHLSASPPVAGSALTDDASSALSVASVTLRRGSPPVLVPPRTVPLPHTGTLFGFKRLTLRFFVLFIINDCQLFYSDLFCAECRKINTD
jgi:hypothetical protein